MHDLIAKAEDMGASFADLRYYKTKEISIVVTEDRQYVSVNGIDEGYSLRTLYEGNWGYSSFVKSKDNELENAIKSSYGNANVNIVYLPPKHDIVHIKPKKMIVKSPDEIANDLKLIKNELLKDERIKSVNIRYYQNDFYKEYHSTEDRDITLQYALSGLYISTVAREGDIVAAAFDGKSTYLGYPLEVFDVNEMISTLKKRINNQLKGVATKAGEFDTILAPDVVGVFSHEALGHLAEADIAINGILEPLRGKKIAPDYVSVVDSPNLSFDMAIGLTPYDDEGVEGREVKIIDKGVVSEFLVDRYYSAYLGEKPSGNARAEDFRSPVIIRMRNTYMLSGEWNLNEMIEDTKDGYLLSSPLGGQTSPDGTFQFGIQEGYKIENGEIKYPLRNVGISGYTLETLNRISAVSKEFDVWPGFCGKGGQSVPVGTGGPYIKVKIKVGGVA
ncbi:zinc metalloprotease TldD [Acidianus brierleyi]|uniref:Zn-dependent protease n=1 Tax=Acidianus brierleyi TaxID=41673 RepID=A0A2U9IFG3_9CREN|nr:zinc metalloprotease TldD [Acidianus brierleyi]AWR94736.1 TldD/PmbA family protein [Acidianus brierleyi]